LAKDILTTEEKKKDWLLSKNRKGRTSWHRAATWGRLHVLQEISEMAKGILTEEEIIKELLLATEIDGRTAWQSAVEGGRLYVLEKIWDIAIDLLTKDDIIQELLLATDSDGNNAWKMAFNDNPDLFQKMQCWIEKNLTIQERETCGFISHT